MKKVLFNKKGKTMDPLNVYLDEVDGVISNKDIPLAELIDSLYILKNEKSKKRRELDEIDSRFKELKRCIMEQLELKELKLTGAQGKLAKVSLTQKLSTAIESGHKEEFYRWIVKNNKFEYAQSSVNQAPVKEMLEKGEKIPEFISVHIYDDLNLRKL